MTPSPPPPLVAVVGGGLAGCECAWQLARCGLRVRLFEMRPHRRSAAHQTDALAELVCSNSLRARSLHNAIGLIKEEMRRTGSLIMAAAAGAEVPAGGALAVDREVFAAAVTASIEASPSIEVVRGEVRGLDDAALTEADAVVLATGPLTSEGLARSLSERTGREKLYFYDAIAPVVEADSLDPERVFAASRYGKGGDDYLNCAMDEPTYHHFIDALIEAEVLPLHGADEARFFPGCQPIEEIARSGRLAPAFGPMKPVGLKDPQTGRRPFAVVQLRAENRARTAYNLVGFQTRLRHGEQRRVFRSIPGLEEAAFLRLGSVHRNTFVDSPRVLDDRMRLLGDDRLRLAGQMTGVEGYVESTACGQITAWLLAADLLGAELAPPPATTAMGAMLSHLRAATSDFQPSNVHWGHFPPMPAGWKPEKVAGRRLQRRDARAQRRAFMSARALDALDEWWSAASDALGLAGGDGSLAHSRASG